MKLVIAFRDAFVPGGLPTEIRCLSSSLAAEHEVSLWGLAPGESGNFPNGVRHRQYGGLIQLCRDLPDWLAQDRPDAVMVVSFFLHQNLPVLHAARRRNITTVLHPGVQVMDEQLRGKLFYGVSEVRDLETLGPLKPSLRRRFATWASPHAKKAYLRLAGPLILSATDVVATLSPVEEEAFEAQFPRSGKRFLTLHWGCSAVTGLDDQQHFYRDGLGLDDEARANFVYWGRIEWHYKGTDRLLAGVKAVRKRLGNAPAPFRLFLIGPDYAGGSKTAQDFIDQHGLQDLVRLLLPGSYVGGSRAPLRDADGCILLTRWDGIPRSLREATWLGIPVLVSPESHFGQFIERFGNGILLKNPDDPEAVATGLLDLADQTLRSRRRAGALALRDALDWDLVAGRFMKALQED